MKFNDSQEDVIQASVNNILVSAAAGSGKTTVLVERIIRKILAGTLSLDGVLVVTFTKAAAENMQIKIGDAIRKKLEEDISDEQRKILKEQLTLLPGSYILTINSFCSRVIKEKGSELEESNIEPGMIILGEAEKLMLLKRAANEAVDKMYLSFETPEELAASDFYFLTEYFGDGRNDASLIDHLIAAYSKLRSLPDYLDKCDAIINERKSKDSSDEIIMLEYAVKMFLDMFKSANDACRMALDELPYLDIPDKYSSIYEEVFNEILQDTTAVLSADSADVREKFALYRDSLERMRRFDKLGAPKKCEDFNYLKVISAKALLLPYLVSGSAFCAKTWVENDLPSMDLINLLLGSPESFIEKQTVRTRLIGSFAELLRMMDTSYSDLKKRLHSMDFADQEHFAHKILKETVAGEYYRQKFAEIYVDEYQDNSSLQDSTISLIANNNVFMVGDVKQSIYKFRYANPQMFLNRLIAYDKKDGGDLYLLNTNYRSTPEILEFVNKLFEQLMSADATEIEYDDNQKLNAPKKSEDEDQPEEKEPEKPNDLPKVILISKEGAGDQADDSEDDGDAESLEDLPAVYRAEVMAIISEIKEYLKDDEHKLSDICLLMQTNDKCRAVANILNNMGVPAICSEGKSIYDDSDVAVICSLITVIANEHRDECLLGVLLANYRFSNFTVNEIAEITRFASERDMIKMNLCVKLRVFADHPEEELTTDQLKIQGRVRRFLDVIDELRSDSMMLNINELIEKIFAKTGIVSTLKARSSDDVVKLRAFKNWLCDNYMAGGSDISSVAASLEALKLEVKDNASFEFEKTNSDAVTCMTFHKSKGLEYPFVILSNIDKGFKAGESDMLFDEKFGFICDDYADETLPERKRSLEHLLYDREAKLAFVSEQLRLFYVALTRAQKKLTVISSTNKILPDKVIKAARERNLQFGRDTHMDLGIVSNELKAALVRMTGAEAIKPDDIDMKLINFDGFRLVVRSADDLTLETIDYEAQDDIKKTTELSVASIDEMGEPVFEPYKYENICTAPAKTSVSELKKEEQKLAYGEGEELPRIPINLVVPSLEYFERKNEYKSASSQGSLIHDMLRFLDFVAIDDDIKAGKSASEALAAEFGFLEEQGIVKEQMKPVIEKFMAPLEQFIKSDVFADITAAEREDKAFFERPVMFSLKVSDDDDTLVQGILDVMYIKDGLAYIVDYKTDKVKGDDLEKIEAEIRKRHGLQLELYAAAVEASGFKIGGKCVWLIRNGIKIDL